MSPRLLILIFILLYGCRNRPTDSEVPIPSTEQPTEQSDEKKNASIALTYQTLAGSWKLKDRWVRLFIGSPNAQDSFTFEYSPLEYFRGQLLIQGEFLGVTGIYDRRPMMREDWRIIEPQKYFYKTVLTDSTLILTDVDMRFLSEQIGVPPDDYAKDFSSDAIQKGLDALQNIDFSQHPEGLGFTRDYLSFDYFGSRIYD